ncbi:hypothetical protein HNQ40_001693 [Algisphaera agarilytica]|uniref:Uncharacterized protein n=2 Tax=Algisphaera agarilytica TaxID=1385975 RepID=A0A7X0LKG2_9BACT|nr:hypothetical protein [Algisphaera agarilytica]
MVGILLPALGSARRTAKTMKCLVNVRNMQVAHWTYMTDNDGYFIQANLSHSGIVHYNPDGTPIVPWLETLEDYYGSALLHRSPVDESPHWGPAPDGQPITGAPINQRRVTSYGINNYLVDIGSGFNPNGTGPPYKRLIQVPNPSANVHFLIMAYEGAYAGADHPHVESWGFFGAAGAPQLAAQQVQIDAHGGPPAAAESKSNWGFLDGHAVTAEFSEVYFDATENNFDPEVAN